MSHAPNIFEVIRSVSSREEPYHSATLAAMLEWSLASDRRLFDQFWRIAAPELATTPGRDVVICVRRTMIRTGRVDLTLLESDRLRPRRRGEDPGDFDDRRAA